MGRSPAEELSDAKKRKCVPAGKNHRNGPRKLRCGCRSLRDSLGLSLREVGRAVGMSECALHHIEEWRTDVRMTTAMRLAEFYGVGVGELWKRAEGGGE